MIQANIDNHESDCPPEGIDLSDVNFSGFGDSLSEDEKDRFFYEVYDLLDVCIFKGGEGLLKDVLSFKRYWMPYFEKWLDGVATARQEEIESGHGRREDK